MKNIKTNTTNKKTAQSNAENNAAKKPADSTAKKPADAAEKKTPQTANNAANNAADAAKKPADKPTDAAAEKPAQNEPLLTTIINTAAAAGIEYYVNEKKPALYLFRFKSADGKKNPMIFKIRYSKNKRVNMLIKSAYMTDDSIIDKYFNASADNECNYYRYCETGTTPADVKKIIGAFTATRKKAAAADKPADGTQKPADKPADGTQKPADKPADAPAAQ